MGGGHGGARAVRRLRLVVSGAEIWVHRVVAFEGFGRPARPAATLSTPPGTVLLDDGVRGRVEPRRVAVSSGNVRSYEKRSRGDRTAIREARPQRRQRHGLLVSLERDKHFKGVRRPPGALPRYAHQAGAPRPKRSAHRVGVQVARGRGRTIRSKGAKVHKAP